MAVAFVGCLLAVMLTPAGPAGVLYPLRYIDSGDWGLANIHEWQSPDFHSVAHSGVAHVDRDPPGGGPGNGTPGWMGVLALGGVVLSLVACGMRRSWRCGRSRSSRPRWPPAGPLG